MERACTAANLRQALRRPAHRCVEAFVASVVPARFGCARCLTHGCDMVVAAGRCVEALVRFRSKHFFWLATRRTLLVPRPTLRFSRPHATANADAAPRRTATHTPHPHTRAPRLHSLHSIPLLKLGSSARGWASEPHLWLRASFDSRHIVRPRKGHAMPISIRCFVRCEPPSRRVATLTCARAHTHTHTHAQLTDSPGIMTIEHTQLAFSRAIHCATVQKSLVPRGHALFI